MPASYFRAESENGDGFDDPSEGVLFRMIRDLNATDNTFVVIQPDVEGPAWFASVATLDEGGFEVEYRDMRHGEHELTAETDIDRIAREVTMWLASRFPDRPDRDNDFQNTP